METDIKIIDVTPNKIVDYGVCGYKDIRKHKEIRNKIDWFEKYYDKGLRMKVLFSDSGGYQGMLEYLPGEFAHRPVNASGFMFIHCMFIGLKKEFKGKGYGSLILNTCIEEARKQKMKGVAVVTRKGSFMASKDIFVKNGFDIVDKVKPDFELLVLKFDDLFDTPSFKKDVFEDLTKYKKGLTIMRSPQCPYTEKNVNAIIKKAKEMFNLKADLIDVKDAGTAQKVPSPFGTFCIIYNGEVITHHPISNKRFENIMNKLIVK